MISSDIDKARFLKKIFWLPKFGVNWSKSSCLLLTMELRFTFGKRKVSSNIRNSQNIVTMIVVEVKLTKNILEPKTGT